MHIVVVGPMIPPVHGASIVTEALVRFLKLRGDDVRVLNTSPVSGRSWLAWHSSRIGRVLRNVLGVLREPRRTTVYLSPSGGLGLIYDTVVVCACRLRGHRMVLHHHSFAYIDKPNHTMRSIVALAGPEQRHITLSEGMGRRFAARYGVDLAVTAISNLAFFAPPTPEAVMNDGPLRVGYLSNLVLEKGIDRFLDVMEQLELRGSQARGLVAGPYGSDAVRAYVEDRLSRLGNVDYLGPLYGDSKDAFFRSLDVFVFPSRYVNEAAPLVIYEAQAAGARVIVTDRGCLREMAGPDDLLLDANASNIDAAVDAVLAMERNPTDVAARITAFQDRVRHETRVFAAFCAAIESLPDYR